MDIGRLLWLTCLLLLALISFSSPASDSCRITSEWPGEPWTEPCALRSSYDFIIVGGGTAGSVLASRLSEIPQWSVLLLEAGKDETYESKIPFFPLLIEKTQMDWNYTTTRQKICKNLGGYCKYPRGRVLGGSSSINYMLHMRGLQEDFNRWEAEGNSGWSYNDVAPYFKKSENFNSRNNKLKSIGRGGYLPVNENEPTWLTAYLSTALQELGLHETDLNTGTGGGFMPIQVNVLDGSRVSANTAFLKPVLSRHNLDILTTALVTRIVFENRTAVGVEFEVDNKVHFVSASKEVILSAGAINSPQILMLSGVGPLEHLQQFGIPVVQDLPVGLQLQDHVGYFAFFQMKNVAASTGEDTMMALKQYLTNKTGLLSIPLGGLVVVMRNSSLSTMDYPDMQLHLGRGEDQNSCYMNGFVCRPESRGTLRLRSKSPNDPPLIDPNYLNSPNDLKVMRELVEFIFQLAFSTSLSDLGTSYLSHLQPGCENQRDLVDCVIRHYSQTFFHPVATCKMGPRSDPYAVVDSELKVYGVRRLRVVDASVMPNVPSSNINSPTMMVAEKASDMIKADHLEPDMCCANDPYKL